MPGYDFKSLSSQDFEELTRDLLQAEWNVTLEAFKAGRDHGIDLRYSTTVNASPTIVQCKHYVSSTFSKLLSNLRSTELPKVKRLNPGRYVVVTSLGLTPANKEKIISAMKPFVLSTSDVIGRDDLNGMLRRHSNIEHANFKLWLTNTFVIARIIQNAEACQTNFEVDKIRKKLPIFVQSRAYPQARDILDNQRIVIISGVPGIGKTTLAEMLLFAHLDDGYEPVVIQTNLREGKKLFKSSHKQIFYYDDFLGHTYLGDSPSYVGENRDAELISFIEMVQSTPNSRFILTTREHILKQAMQASERFKNANMLNHRYILELADYSFGQRARVLYNHLYFSDLPPIYKEEILRDDFFLSIIKNNHFNPRLVEWMTSLSRLNSPPAEKYQESISELLRSPDKIWSHAFECQISDSARDLLLTIYSLGNRVEIEELEKAFDSFHCAACEKYHRLRKPTDFRTSLKELDGAFLSYSDSIARFINPSIRDFTAHVLCESPQLALEIIANATRFKQISTIWMLSKEDGAKALANSILENKKSFFTYLERVLYGKSTGYLSNPGNGRHYTADASEELRLRAILDWTEALNEPEFFKHIEKYTSFLINHWGISGISFYAADQVLEKIKSSSWLLEKGGDKIYRTLLDQMLLHLTVARAKDWRILLSLPKRAILWTRHDRKKLKAGFKFYIEEGLDNERDDCTTIDEKHDLLYALQELQEEFQVSLSETIYFLEQAIEEIEEDKKTEDNEGGGFSETADAAQIDPVSENDVREMFQSLRASH